MSMGLEPGQWKVNPRSGIISLSEEAFDGLCNKDPIEKWYTIDPEPIARGRFTSVHRCIHRVSGDEFAAKFSSKRRLGSDCTAVLVHEVAVCALLKEAKRVVRLVDVFNTESELILVMEYAPGGDLQTLLDEDLVPYERNVIGFLRQLLNCLDVIHDKNIVHLDIKPQNLVLMGDFPDCCVKLCDFEISRMLTSGYEVREILGTADYVAPEIIHYEPITTKTDMWSLGVLTYVLLTGFLPFGGENDQETFLEITRGELDFPEELFEDISEHAIDFIKRLLIRQPHLRMSAKECLQHSWMQADKKMSKISSQTLYLNSVNSNTSPHSSVESQLNNKQQTSIFRQQTPAVNSNLNSPSLPLPNTNYPTSNLNELELGFSLQRALDILEKSTANTSTLTTSPKTPGILTPVHSSPRDTGLPPLHPYMSSKFCPSAHSSSSSLNRGASRQSLERLRSISKSREVLVERLQNSSQRKALSRSRERLFDGRYGLTKSDNGLFEQRSFSHSVELLPPFDLYAYDESIYSSFNSVNMLPILSVLPLLDEHNINNRQYKSLASMERLHEETNENKYATNGSAYLNSRLPTSKSDYNKIMSRYRPGSTSENFERKSSDRRCSDNERAKSEENENEIIRKQNYRRASNEAKLDKDSPSKQNTPTRVKKTDKSKKELQKRKKEKEKDNKYSVKSRREETSKSRTTKDREISPPKPTIDKKRGSVSHIEQRIQERQERLQKKEETAKREKPKRTNQSRPSISQGKSKESPTDHVSKYKPHKSERHKISGEVNQKNNCKDKLHSSMEESPCSSLESVTEFINNNNINNNNNNKLINHNSDFSAAETKITSPNKPRRGSEPEKDSKKTFRKNFNPPTRNSPRQNSKREAVESSNCKLKAASLDEPTRVVIDRSNSLDSTITLTGSESTVGAENAATEKLEDTLKNLTVSEIKGVKNDSNSDDICKSTKETCFKGANLKSDDESAKLQDSDKKQLASKGKEAKVSKSNVTATEAESSLIDPLTIISEEEETSAQTTKGSFSKCSSYVLSKKTNEAPNKNKDQSEQKPETHIDGPNRSRSLSMQNRSSSFFPFKLSRSNSIHLDSPLTGKPRPWGEVCDGAVNRACKMFSQKSVEIALIIRKSSDPTSDRL